MKILRTVWAEFYGLFVDDGRFAVAILAWLAAAGLLLLLRLGLPASVSPVLLFAGLAAILVESTVRAARRR